MSRRSLTAAGPIRTTVVRWKCPYCNRHHSRKARAVSHIDRCWKSPANRTCRTCRFHAEAYTAPSSSWCFPGRQCDCNDMYEHCQHENGPELEPGQFPVVGCPLWELRDGSKT